MCRLTVSSCWFLRCPGERLRSFAGTYQKQTLMNSACTRNRKYITCRNDAGGGPSYGHRQHAKNLVKIARVVPEISLQTDRHTRRHTHRRTHHNTSLTLQKRHNTTALPLACVLLLQEPSQDFVMYWGPIVGSDV